MIPQREIIAWREHAPWSKDQQVEQDLLLTRSMVAIFEDDFLRGQVAMRGGTALHKVHLAPPARYSEDIDLVLVGDRPPDHVRKALRRVLKPILGDPKTDIWAEILLTVRNWAMPSKILRLEWTYRPMAAPREEAKLKVEVNFTERQPCYTVVDLQYQVPAVGLGSANAQQVVLRTYDVDEMLGTKMRALLQRQQGRDLFDLWWAWNLSDKGMSRHPIDPDRTVAAFGEYMRREGSVVRRSEFADELSQKMTLQRFRDDMDTMLRPDIPNYSVDEACAAVQEIFIGRLPE